MSIHSAAEPAGLYRTVRKLVLASQSPRRIRFFTDLGLQFSISPAQLDERCRQGEDANQFVTRMAAEKAVLISSRDPAAWVVSADTIVTLDGRVLGKPVSAEQAFMMLMSLSGRQHEVRTGYCLRSESGGVMEVDLVLTRVAMTAFSAEVAQAYVATGEPLDKAGSYGIQGLGGSLVKRVEGSYSNVVGLPLVEIVELLLRYEIISLAGKDNT